MSARSAAVIFAFVVALAAVAGYARLVPPGPPVEKIACCDASPQGPAEIGLRLRARR